MTTRTWSRSTTERKAAWNHYGGVAVWNVMWKHDTEGDYENNYEGSSTITAHNNPQLSKSSKWGNRGRDKSYVQC